MSDLIPARLLAAQLGMHRSHVKGWALRNGIAPGKARVRKQKEIVFTKQEAEMLVRLRGEQGFSKAQEADIGCFYVIQLLPDIYPSRVKLGYADSLDERLKSHRTVAPNAKVLKSWKCKRVWEAAAIDCVTTQYCKNVGGEVFDCGNVEWLLERGDLFFSMMP